MQGIPSCTRQSQVNVCYVPQQKFEIQKHCLDRAKEGNCICLNQYVYAGRQIFGVVNGSSLIMTLHTSRFSIVQKPSEHSLRLTFFESWLASFIVSNLSTNTVRHAS